MLLAVPVGISFALSANLELGEAAGIGMVVGVAAFWITVGIVRFIASGLSSKERRPSDREVPSPGLEVRIRVGVVCSLVAGGLAGVLAGLIVAWPGAAEEGRRYGLITGIMVAFSVALCSFGIQLVEQLALRFLIARSGILPWPCRPLLDHATKLLLLRKVGQDYLFVHRDLLDFLADLVPGDSPDSGDLPAERLVSLLPEPSARNMKAATSSPVVSPPP